MQSGKARWADRAEVEQDRRMCWSFLGGNNARTAMNHVVAGFCVLLGTAALAAQPEPAPSPAWHHAAARPQAVTDQVRAGHKPVAAPSKAGAPLQTQSLADEEEMERQEKIGRLRLRFQQLLLQMRAQKQAAAQRSSQAAMPTPSTVTPAARHPAETLPTTARPVQPVASQPVSVPTQPAPTAVVATPPLPPITLGMPWTAGLWPTRCSRPRIMPVRSVPIAPWRPERREAAGSPHDPVHDCLLLAQPGQAGRGGDALP